jgi:hypothetical protein
MGGGWWQAPTGGDPYRAECGVAATELNDSVVFTVSRCSWKNWKEGHHLPPCPDAFILQATVQTI